MPKNAANNSKKWRLKMEIKITEPSLQERRIAEEASLASCSFLNTSTDAIKFFREVGEYEDNFGSFTVAGDHLLGFTIGGTIYLRRGLAREELANARPGGA
jgi:hypothetical protein